MPVGREFYAARGYVWSGALAGMLAMVLLSLFTPIISLLKSGYSYKGRPGLVRMSSHAITY